MQHISEVIEIELVADRHKNVAGSRADGLQTQLALQLQVELVHLYVSHTTMPGPSFGNREHDIQDHREYAASHGGDGLCEKVGDRNQEQNQGNQTEPHGYLHAAHSEIERHWKFALTRNGIAQHQHRQAVHGEAPYDAECVQIGEEGDVAAA